MLRDGKKLKKGVDVPLRKYEKMKIEARDLGWNCLAIKKDGEECIAFRKNEKQYCGIHLRSFKLKRDKEISKLKIRIKETPFWGEKILIEDRLRKD